MKFGISFTTTFLNQAGALVLVYEDGSVQLNHGGTEMGQGVYIKVAQVMAETFGISLDHIRITATRTDKVPNTSATAASAGADLNGKAAEAAALEIRGRLAVVAGVMLGVTPDQVVFANDTASAGGRSITFAEVAHKAWLERVSLAASGFYATPDIHFDRASGAVGHSTTMPMASRRPKCWSTVSPENTASPAPTCCMTAATRSIQP